MFVPITNCRAGYLYTICVFCTHNLRHEIGTPYTGICTHKIEFKFLIELQVFTEIIGCPKLLLKYTGCLRIFLDRFSHSDIMYLRKIV